MKLALVLVACCLPARMHNGGAMAALTLHGNNGSIGGSELVSNTAQQQLDDDSEEADDDDGDEADDADDADDANDIEGVDLATVAAFEKLLVTGQVDASSFGQLVSKINVLVANLSTEVNKSHSRSQAALEEALLSFDRCRGPKWNTSSDVSSNQVDALAESSKEKQLALGQCIASKPNFVKMVETCKATVKALTAAKDATCAEWALNNALQPNVEEQCALEGREENSYDYMKRMSEYIDGEMRRLLAAEGRCNSAKAALPGPIAECEALKKNLSIKEADCLVKSSSWQLTTCQVKTTSKFMCRQYSTCYKAQVKSYKDLVNQTAGEVTLRKGQWQVLHNLGCMAHAYDAKTGKISTERMKKCTAETASTDHLDINSTDVPDKVSCGIPAALIQVIAAARCDSLTATTTTATTTVASP